jgi:hypothetical protein
MRAFSVVAIKRIKHTQQRPEGCLTVRESAQVLGTTIMTVRLWISKSIVPEGQVQRIESETGSRVYVSAAWVKKELDRQRVDLSLRTELLANLQSGGQA